MQFKIATKSLHYNHRQGYFQYQGKVVNFKKQNLRSVK